MQVNFSIDPSCILEPEALRFVKQNVWEQIAAMVQWYRNRHPDTFIAFVSLRGNRAHWPRTNPFTENSLLWSEPGYGTALERVRYSIESYDYASCEISLLVFANVQDLENHLLHGPTPGGVWKAAKGALKLRRCA